MNEKMYDTMDAVADAVAAHIKSVSEEIEGGRGGQLELMEARIEQLQKAVGILAGLLVATGKLELSDLSCLPGAYGRAPLERLIEDQSK